MFPSVPYHTPEIIFKFSICFQSHKPKTNGFIFFSVQFSAVAQLCPTLCNPMNHSTPGLPVHQRLPEPTQTHVH